MLHSYLIIVAGLSLVYIYAQVREYNYVNSYNYIVESSLADCKVQTHSIYYQGRIQRLKKGGHTYRVEIGAARVGRSCPCAR